MPTATRYRKPKDFRTLWQEQRSAPTSQPRYKGTYTTGNPYPPGSADYYAHQAFVGPGGGFASDHIWQEQHAGYDTHEQKARERANRLANLDQNWRAWSLQLPEPSVLDASLDTLGRDIAQVLAMPEYRTNPIHASADRMLLEWQHHAINGNWAGGDIDVTPVIAQARRELEQFKLDQQPEQQYTQHTDGYIPLIMGDTARSNTIV